VYRLIIIANEAHCKRSLYFNAPYMKDRQHAVRSVINFHSCIFSPVKFSTLLNHTVRKVTLRLINFYRYYETKQKIETINIPSDINQMVVVFTVTTCTHIQD